MPLRRPSLREIAQVAGLLRPLAQDGETEIFCDLAIVGAGPAGLEAEGRESFEGGGVYYAATAMESKLCRHATVIVAGGGNSAGQAAMFISESAQKVLLVIRGENLNKSMSSYLSRRIETKDNIKILRNTKIRKMTGENHLEAVELENVQTGSLHIVETSR